VRQLYILLLAASLTGCIADGLLNPSSQTSTPTIDQSAEAEVEEVEVVAEPPASTPEAAALQPVTQGATELTESRTSALSMTGNEMPDVQVEMPTSIPAAPVIEGLPVERSTVEETDTTATEPTQSQDETYEAQDAGLTVSNGEDEASSATVFEDGSPELAEDVVTSDAVVQPSTPQLDSAERDRVLCPCPTDIHSSAATSQDGMQAQGVAEQINRVLIDQRNGTQLSDGLLLELVSTFFGTVFAFALATISFFWRSRRAQREDLADRLLYEIGRYQQFKGEPQPKRTDYRRYRIEDIENVIKRTEKYDFLTDAMLKRIEDFKTSIGEFNDSFDDRPNITDTQSDQWNKLGVVFMKMVKEIYRPKYRHYKREIAKLRIKERATSFWLPDWIWTRAPNRRQQLQEAA